MIKWMLGFALAVVLVGFVLDAYSQTPTQSIILGPNNEIVGQIVTYPPIPQWR